MAIAVRSSSTLAFAGGRTSSVFTAPSGIVNDDILLCVLSAGDASLLPPLAVTAPAGWTEAAGSPAAREFTSGTYTISLRVYWKKAASESGSYTFTHAAGGTEGLMYCLSGAHLTTPLSPTPTTSTDGNPGVGNGMTTTALSLTTLVDGCFIVMAEALWDDTTGMVVPTGTTPTLTQRLAGTIFYVSDGILAAAGATGDRTHTNGNNGTGAPWVSFHLAMQPAAVAQAGAAGLTGSGAGGAYFATNTDSDDRGTIASRKRRRKFLEDRARRIREL